MSQISLSEEIWPFSTKLAVCRVTETLSTSLEIGGKHVFPSRVKATMAQHYVSSRQSENSQEEKGNP